MSDKLDAQIMELFCQLPAELRKAMLLSAVLTACANEKEATV